MKTNGQAGSKIKVLLVDDHPMMRDGLRMLIGNEADMEVVGEADDVPNALELAEKLKPDVALVDITLRVGNGLELIKDMQLQVPKTSILVLSMHDESLYAERVLKAGGRGYIMKEEGGKKIMEALRIVANGKTYVSSNIASKILDSYSGSNRESKSPIENLTDREFEVFQLIGQGLSTKGMAEKLCVSVKTIEVHRVHIKEKLNIGSAAELIRFAVRWMEAQNKT